MADSVLGGTIGFLADLGVYDIVLPFLLVFTLLFAFLEKTKVLGVEEIKDSEGNVHTYTRKSLNSVIAFTSAFFVIASTELVRILSEVMANTMILIVAGLCFMLATGVVHTGKGEFDLGALGKNGIWKKGFFIVNLIGIVLILFNALGWLEAIYSFVVKGWDSAAIATFLMILVFVGFMAWIASPGKAAKPAQEKED